MESPPTLGLSVSFPYLGLCIFSSSLLILQNVKVDFMTAEQYFILALLQYRARTKRLQFIE